MRKAAPLICDRCEEPSLVLTEVGVFVVELGPGKHTAAEVRNAPRKQERWCVECCKVLPKGRGAANGPTTARRPAQQRSPQRDLTARAS